MAWQLSTAATPTGEAGLQNLIAGEQANRVMGQQAMAQQQQTALGQQALQQEQAAMAQRQQQFEQGMAQDQAMAQMQFQNASALARQQNEFNAAQNDALMQWQQKQTADLQKFQLQIEMLDAQKEEALSTGMVGVAQKAVEQRVALLRAKAKKAQQIALSSRLRGQTKEAAERMLNGYEAQLGRVVNAEQRNQEVGKRFVDTLLGTIDSEGKQVNIGQLKAFLAKQHVSEGISPVTSFFAEPSFKELEMQVNSGEAPGLEFLSLAPTSLGKLQGLSFYSTADASAIAGEMDAATMTNVLKGRISKGVMSTLRAMGLKGFDEDAAQQLVDGALSGKGQQDLAGLAERAKIPTSTLKVLLGAAADRYAENDTNEAWTRLNQGEASAIEAAGGQLSLRREGFRKQKEAFKTMGKMLRTAANAFPGMDLDEINAGLEVVKNMKQTGRYSPLIEPSAEAAGLGGQLGELRKLYRELPAAEEALIRESTGLGDIAEEQAVAEEMMPVQMLGAQRAAMGERYKALQKLLEGYQ